MKRELKDLTNNDAIHCKTIESFNKICKLLDNSGYERISNQSYSSLFFVSGICLLPYCGTINNYNYFVTSGYNIFDADEFFEKDKLTELPKNFYIKYKKDILWSEYKYWLQQDIRGGYFYVYKYYGIVNNEYSCTDLIDDDIPVITLEEWKELTTNTKNIKMKYTLKPEQAQSIIDIACSTWKQNLSDIWSKDIVLKNIIIIEEEYYKKMRSVCTKEQHILFDEIFGEEVKEFNSSMLKVGEYMIITNGCDYINDIILKTHNNYVSITNPSCVWINEPKFIGKKINFNYAYSVIN